MRRAERGVPRSVVHSMTYSSTARPLVLVWRSVLLSSTPATSVTVMGQSVSGEVKATRTGKKESTLIPRLPLRENSSTPVLQEGEGEGE
jgi:hypothetical protein